MSAFVRLLALLGFSALAACSSATPPAGPACTSDLDCDYPLVCVSGVCVAPPVTTKDCSPRANCSTSADCGQSGACEAGCCIATCTTSRDCASEEECRSGRCREVGAACTANSDCTSGGAPICDLASGACVRCLADADCGLGEYCRNYACKAPARTGCISDEQCTEVPQLSHCLATEGRCVACLSDAQCPRPSVGTVTCDLVNHACRIVVPGCDRNADCLSSPFGKVCDVDNRTCVACLEDAQCPAGAHCTREHVCEAAPPCTESSCPATKPKCRADRTCVECLVNGDCGSGRVCSSNRCIAAQNGCFTNAMCLDPTPACDLTTRSCVTCRDDNDCNLRFCRSGSCVSCTDNLDCAVNTLGMRPFCDAGRSGGCSECMGDGDCSNGLVCVDRRCVVDPTDTLCPTTGVCPRDLVCTPDPNRGPSFCRKTCDPYSTANSCSADKACNLVRFSGGLPVGACQPKVPGFPQLGELCGDYQPCDTGLVCVPEGNDRGTCRRPCDPYRSTASCTAPNECQPLVILDTQGIPRSVGACSPPSKYLEACSSDAGCDNGQVCAPGPNPMAPAQFRNECLWARGNKTAAQPCNANEECRSGICIQGMPKGQGTSGFCQGACARDADCPARSDGRPGACELYPLPWFDASGTPTTVAVNSCVVTCSEDLECPSGMSCEAVPNATKSGWVTRCRTTPPGATGKGGSPCTAGGECKSGTCITYGVRPTGICGAVCGPSGDANCAPGTSCPPDGVMRNAGPGPDNISGNADDAWSAAPICWGRSCTADRDCGTGRVCGADMDPQNRADIELSCRPAQGSKMGGDTCAQDSDCKSGFCVNWSSSNKRCFGACQQASDCAPGSTCRLRKWTNTTPNKDVQVCSP